MSEARLPAVVREFKRNVVIAFYEGLIQISLVFIISVNRGKGDQEFGSLLC